MPLSSSFTCSGSDTSLTSYCMALLITNCDEPSTFAPFPMKRSTGLTCFLVTAILRMGCKGSHYSTYGLSAHRHSLRPIFAHSLYLYRYQLKHCCTILLCLFLVCHALA